MVASSTVYEMDSAGHQHHHDDDSNGMMESTKMSSYQEEMCDKLIQLSFAKIVNSKTERGGARLRKNLLILHLLQKARLEQRNRILSVPSPMDTSRSEYETEAGSDGPDSVVVMGNGEMDNIGDDTDQRKGIEIDETAGEQRVSSGNDEMASTFGISRVSDLPSPYLSSPLANGSSETGCFTDTGRRVELERTDRFDFSSQLNKMEQAKLEVVDVPVQKSKVERDDSSGTTTTTHKHHEDKDGQSDLRQHRSKQRRGDHNGGRCEPTKRRSENNRKEYSSSSSSDESDGWSSSEENDTPIEYKKSRDSLKRKWDEDASGLTQTDPNPISTSDRYSSPKMACLQHRNDTQQQHQLNGLISVFQSAALTSDDSSNPISDDNSHDDSKLALVAGIYDESKGGPGTLTRSLSCPGLMELACES